MGNKRRSNVHLVRVREREEEKNERSNMQRDSGYYFSRFVEKFSSGKST